MAVVSFTIPDAVLPRVLDDFATLYGWTAASPFTKAEFARQQVIAYVKGVVVQAESAARVNAAQATLGSEVTALGIT